MYNSLGYFNIMNVFGLMYVSPYEGGVYNFQEKGR